MTDIMAEAVEAIEKKNLEVLFLTDLLNLILKGKAQSLSTPQVFEFLMMKQT